MNKYTVILAYPRKLQDDHLQTYVALVKGKTTAEALKAARREAFYAQPNWNRHDLCLKDWPCLLILDGHAPLNFIGTIRTVELLSEETVRMLT
jgi:hypothetical protein